MPAVVPRRELALTLAVGVAALVAQLPIFDRAIFLLDEGYVMQLADEINRGKVLYRDVNVDAPFPGAFYLLAAWFRAFGTTTVTARWFAVSVFAVFTMLAFRVAREVGTHGWALGLVVLVLCYRIWAFPQWHTLHYSPLSTTFLTATLLVLLWWCRRERRVVLVAAGALTGAAIVCKQDYGVSVTAAFVLALLVRPWLVTPWRSLGSGVAHAAWFGIGAACVLVPVMLAFATVGALGPLVEQTLVRPFAAATSFPYVRLPALLPLFRQDGTLRAEIGQYLPGILITLRGQEIVGGATFRDTAVWDTGLKLAYWAPILLCGVAALVWLVPALARARRADARPDDSIRLLLLAFAAGFLLAFNRPRDWAHLVMMFPAAMLLATALCAQAPGAVRTLLAGVAVVGLALLLPVSVRLGLELRGQLTARFAHARAGLWIEPAHQPIADVISWVEASAPPGTPVPAIPLQPMVDFLAAREGAGGFYIIWPLFQHPERDARIIADMERRHVEVVVYGVSQFRHLGTFRENAPRLFAYLAERFAIERVFARDTYGLLFCGLRRRAAGEGMPLGIAPAAAEPGTAAPAVWPFAHVIAQRIGSPASPPVARLPAVLPASAPRLLLRYGINPERWLDPPSGPFTFRVAVEPEGAPPETLLEATLDPYRRIGDRLWPEAALDLTRWRGQRVVIMLSVAAAESPSNPSDLAGWSDVRVVER